MRRHPIYALFGTMVLLGVGVAEYRGWSLSRVSQIKNIPRSVRDNPGAYRSIYAGHSRYIGGK